MERPLQIAFLLGTRPEAIKLAPLLLAMREHPRFEPRLCVTGQHRELLDQALAVFDLKPERDLGLMQPDQSLAQFASRAIAAIDAYLAEARPDMALVQGDTSTVFCGALCGFYRGLPVGHVEAGLRTGNRLAPFPEESNRVLASRLATLHFAPTDSARDNLLAEGVDPADVCVTGNTGIDALLLAVDKIEREGAPRISGLPGDVQPDSPDGPPLVLITGHRRESFGEGFENICRAIADLAARRPETHFVYPVHLNPRVREPVGRLLEAEARSNVHLIEPLAYLPFVALMRRATLVLTDSGGIQEEAPSLGKPVLVMRETTERPEAVEMGCVRLVGARREAIVEGVARLLEDPAARQAMARAVNPYGDGRACGRILEAIATYFDSRP